MLFQILGGGQFPLSHPCICVSINSEDLRCNWSSHVVALPGKVQSLDPCGTVSFEPQEVYDVDKFGREKGDGQVEDAVTETHGRHQTLDGGRRKQAEK